MKRHLSLSAIAAALLFVAMLPSAQAATYSNGSQSAQFQVSLSLAPSCSISAAPLLFGTPSALTAAVNAQTNLTVTCSNTTPYNVGLDGGTVTGSTIASRLLAGTATGNTGTTVKFGLYLDSGFSTNWTNTQGSGTFGGTGTGVAQAIPVFGQVPSQSTPQPDTYATTITATVFF